MVRRVKSLTYTVIQLNPAKRIVSDAPAVDVDFPGFSCHLEGPRLTASPDGGYDSEDEARAVLEPLLRGWEAKADLVDGYPLRFDFLMAHTEEAEQQYPDDQVARTAATVVALQQMEVTVRQDRQEYPLPDPEIRWEGPVTAILRPRWRQVLRGRESVSAGSYFIITVVQEQFGGNPTEAAKSLNISLKVIKKLRRVASTYDPDHGRKASEQVAILTSDYSLTSDHLLWMRAACALIVGRVMEHEANADTSSKITMADLPHLR